MVPPRGSIVSRRTSLSTVTRSLAGVADGLPAPCGTAVAALPGFAGAATGAAEVFVGTSGLVVVADAAGTAADEATPDVAGACARGAVG
jgi:hypothetical protein